jgi:hypothetical protein
MHVRTQPWRTSALAVMFAFAPAGMAAQGLSVGAKIGTVGVGGEVALGLTPRLTVRGGIGFMPFDIEGDVDDIAYTVAPPAVFMTAGVDLKVVGPLRLMGGLLYRSEGISLVAEVTGSTEVGDGTFTSSGTLEGLVDSSSLSPFVGIGIGHATGSGVGVFLDVAVAFTGDPTLDLTASGPISQEPGFAAELEKERSQAEQNLGEYYQYWPILSFGIRFGIGR